ncbi:app2p [Saccharomyces arboricola H-6]|uniref:App2p n=1 Tax=Saccharomyces arboricola (strain H-6 / AS 2.3317 / CBS 10644) TaxID=1160507 RepID=J8Q3B1_SACAR|nr:app2p [Saccharomyces arboricola H-6]
MASNENISKEDVEILVTPHQTQLEKIPGDGAPENEEPTIASNREANQNQKAEDVNVDATSGFGSSQGIKNGVSNSDLSNPHEVLLQTEIEPEKQGEAQSESLLVSEELSQQLETEESKVEEALAKITSPPLPQRVDNVEMSMPMPAKLPSPPVPPRNENGPALVHRPELPQRQVINAETLHLKAPHVNVVPAKPTVNNLGRSSSSAPPILPPRRIGNPLDLAAQKDLLASTFKKNLLFYKSEDTSIKSDLDENISILKKESDKIDAHQLPEEVGSFWVQTVNDYQHTLLNNIENLHVQLSRGIPPAYRLIVWQLVSYAKSKSFDPIYKVYLTQEAPFDVQGFEDQLNVMDGIPYTNAKRITNVLKAYLLFDSECEFSIDMAYIINMLLEVCEKEVDAFGLFVRLMKVYDLRLLFLPSAPEIEILCYKFDRLVEESCPDVYHHMVEKGVRSSMFLADFFATLFQKKLPNEIQPRIGDIVFLESLDSIMRIPVTLLYNTRAELLKMDFEELLEFLKSGLLDAYIRQEGNAKSDSPSLNNCMDKLLQNAMMEVQITPKSMKKYASEYDEIHRLDNEREEQYKAITGKNLHLQKHVRKLENGYTSLNREHVTIANELVKNRLNIESVLNENNGYKLQILDLKKKLDSEKKKQISIAYVPNDLKEDLEETMKKNAQVMDENLKLQDRISELERTIEAIKTANNNGTLFEYSNSRNHSSGTAWSGFKKVFK